MTIKLLNPPVIQPVGNRFIAVTEEREKRGLLKVPTVSGEVSVVANKTTLPFGRNLHSFITYSGIDDPSALETFLALFWNEGVNNFLTLTVKPSEGQLHHLENMSGQQFGKFQLSASETLEETPDFKVVKSELMYLNDNETTSRTIRHLQYKTWSDHGTIDDNSDKAMQKLNALLDTIERYVLADEVLPINCNGGISRTGFVMQALILRQLERQGIRIPLSVLKEAILEKTYIEDSSGLMQTSQLETYYNQIYGRSYAVDADTKLPGHIQLGSINQFLRYHRLTLADALTLVLNMKVQIDKVEEATSLYAPSLHLQLSNQDAINAIKFSELSSFFTKESKDNGRYTVFSTQNKGSFFRTLDRALRAIPCKNLSVETKDYTKPSPPAPLHVPITHPVIPPQDQSTRLYNQEGKGSSASVVRVPTSTEPPLLLSAEQTHLLTNFFYPDTKPISAVNISLEDRLKSALQTRTCDFTLALKEDHYIINCTTYAAAETLNKAFGLGSTSRTFKLNHSEAQSLVQGNQVSKQQNLQH
ncbi:MAG: hypothetical protein IPP74_09610 [Alphaproteobacteria bacterium]|nr:hypothetical protein [Alphaproteobacteria bacterium]